jgi:hypothetical protein
MIMSAILQGFEALMIIDIRKDWPIRAGIILAVCDEIFLEGSDC